MSYDKQHACKLLKKEYKSAINKYEKAVVEKNGEIAMISTDRIEEAQESVIEVGGELKIVNRQLSDNSKKHEEYDAMLNDINNKKQKLRKVRPIQKVESK